MAKTIQSPIRLASLQKHDVRSQFGAIAYRILNGKTQILLVTTRGSGRWIIPKGWPMDNMTPAEAAEREAFEEAGATGKMQNICLGIYSYQKGRGADEDLPCIVALFPMRVKKLTRKFPEAGQRKRQWFSPKKAALKVDEPELAQIIRAFDPARLPK